ncbi:MAG: phosphoenolpyruvate hydrolase family protein [bacterium]
MDRDLAALQEVRDALGRAREARKLLESATQEEANRWAKAIADAGRKEAVRLARMAVEETGMGYELEVDMIRQAGEIGLLTTPYAFTPEEAAAMAEAGADILIPHMGLTTKGMIGASSALSLEEAASRCQAMHDAAKAIKPDILVLCHGGPIAEPEDAQFILDHTEGIVGFYGASSMERLPVEPAITNRVREFTELQFRQA